MFLSRNKRLRRNCESLSRLKHKFASGECKWVLTSHFNSNGEGLQKQLQKQLFAKTLGTPMLNPTDILVDIFSTDRPTGKKDISVEYRNDNCICIMKILIKIIFCNYDYEYIIK